MSKICQACGGSGHESQVEHLTGPRPCLACVGTGKELPTPPVSGSVWLHVKSGNLYRVVTCALAEEDLTPVVVYQAMYGEHKTWIRPVVKFMDGRFKHCHHSDTEGLTGEYGD